jgi:cbb3-type cytochrome oxidase subunit 3
MFTLVFVTDVKSAYLEKKKTRFEKNANNVFRVSKDDQKGSNEQRFSEEML